MKGLDKKGLKRALILFFLALAVPSGILIWQAYSQLKWQSFHQQRLIAEELSARIDLDLRRLIEQEESRSFDDYRFFRAGGDATMNYLQRSALSNFPVSSTLPGLIGYFQVDAQGTLSTPLLPVETRNLPVSGIPASEYAERLALQNRIHGILNRNRLVGNGNVEQARSHAVSAHSDRPQQRAGRLETGKTESGARSKTAVDETAGTMEADRLSGQAAFDRLNSPSRRNLAREKSEALNKRGRISDLNLDYSYQSGSAVAPPSQHPTKIFAESKRLSRKEQITAAKPAPRLRADRDLKRDSKESQRILTFESEIDPFEFSLLDSGHFVLFRKVWRNGQRYVQGLLIKPQDFVKGIARPAFDESSLSEMSDLIIAFQGNVVSGIRSRERRQPVFDVEGFSGSVLYQTRLSPPLSDIELVFSVTGLPPGPGAELITWVAMVLGGVLVGGFLLMYRAGLVQINAVRQQRNFVSAISHELKTPLTSIRMYSEMLRAGWTPEEKKISYYEYILCESERLTRLINNVLQLAKLGRDESQIDIRSVRIETLIEEIRQKVQSQTQAAGFCVDLSIAPEVRDLEIRADPDAFTQIIINLVDNAIKFSRKSEHKKIEIRCERAPANTVRFSVRDFGPGVAASQIKKIFRLFYRAENELTRETVGTGIGLALVQQLASRMNGQADVVNRAVGAEFRITLPMQS